MTFDQAKADEMRASREHDRQVARRDIDRMMEASFSHQREHGCETGDRCLLRLAIVKAMSEISEAAGLNL